MGCWGGRLRRSSSSPSTPSPRYISPNYLQAFDRQENLTLTPNWLYLAGASLPELQRAWHAFGQYAQLSPAGAMVLHSEFTDVIGPNGRLRYLLNSDPWPGTEATRASFSVVLADTLKKVIASS